MNKKLSSIAPCKERNRLRHGELLGGMGYFSPKFQGKKKPGERYSRQGHNRGKGLEAERV